MISDWSVAPRLITVADTPCPFDSVTAVTWRPSGSVPKLSCDAVAASAAPGMPIAIAAAASAAAFALSIIFSLLMRVVTTALYRVKQFNMINTLACILAGREAAPSGFDFEQGAAVLFRYPVGS